MWAINKRPGSYWKHYFSSFYIYVERFFMKSILLFMNFFLIFFLSCEKNKTPLEPLSKYFTSHDYEWTVDTLYTPGALQLMIAGIWGTNENNVWVVGHSDETKYQAWHWDGKQWENQYLLFAGHPHSLKAIYGFSESNVWAVGVDYRNYPAISHRSLITHYDGNVWALEGGIDAPECLSVWGSDLSGLFVGCDSGIVLHFDGSQWKKQYTGTHAQILSIKGTGADQIYAIGAGLDDLNPYDSTFYYFFKYNDNHWNILDSFIKYPYSPTDKFGENLWISPEGNIYTAGNDGLFRWNENAWTRLRTEQLFGIGGTGWSNIFVAGPWNNMYHFNGQSWRRYDYFDNYFYDAGFSFWCNEEYVFMSAQEGYRSYVIRGKLIE